MAANHFRLTVDQDDLRRLINDLQDIRDGVPKALKAGVNRVLKGVKTDMTNETHKVLALKKKRIREDMWISKYATQNEPQGTVSSEGRPVNLAQFQATQTKKGISVRVLRSEPKKLIRGAFFATVTQPDGGQAKLVFWRKKTDEKKDEIGTEKRKPWLSYARLPYRYRLPIEALYGPRIQDITARPSVMANIEESGRQRLKQELSRQADRMLKRAKRT